MDELTLKQAAIDALCDNCNHVQSVCPHYPCKQYTSIEQLLSAQPEITEDVINDAHNEGYDVGYWAGRRDYEPKWIPVTERLPEKNGRYLVTRGLSACGALWNRVYIINFSDLMGLKSKRIWWYGNVGKSDFVRVEDVIAWMPLFEPYREETKNA